jgi:hypothetical protein
MKEISLNETKKKTILNTDFTTGFVDMKMQHYM